MPKPELRLVPGAGDELDALVLKGQEHLVDEMVESHRLIKTCGERLEERRNIVEPLAAILRTKEERKGKFSKVVCVLGSERNMTLTWGNSFRDVAQGSVALVKRALGRAFDKLFVVKEKHEVRSEAVDELRRILGRRFEEIIQTTRWAEALPDFRERRFRILHELNKAQDKHLDDLIDQLAHKPVLRFT